MEKYVLSVGIICREEDIIKDRAEFISLRSGIIVRNVNIYNIMKNISQVIGEKQNDKIASSKVSSERADLISQFVGRVENKKGKLEAKRVAILLSPYSVSDLYALIKKCEQANHFNKTFWWHLKK